MSKGDTEYAALAEALNETTPPCSGDWRYTLTASELDDYDQLVMRSTCRTCPLNGLCAAYATAARPTAGMWAGKYYKPWRRK